MSNVAEPAPHTAAASATETQWVLDGSHSSATFSIRHLMISNVRGEFQKVSGSLVFDRDAPQATRLSAAIEVASIHTREAQRDAHLKSADFFDAEKFPTITFVSKSVTPGAPGHLELVGALTIRDTTREVVLHVEGPSPEQADPWGNLRIGATATTKIRRSDFGITWGTVVEAGNILVGDEVTIQLDVSLVKQK